MKLVTAKQMASVDRRAIQEEGVPGLDLMERAGENVFEGVCGLLGTAEGKTVAVVCGKGNNGGDGLVVARLLHKHGAKPEVFLLAKRDQPAGDAKTNLERVLDLGVTVHEVLSDGDLTAMADSLGKSDAVVDAVFGTGLQGQVRGLARRAIEAINASARPVLAVDLPSGLDTDNGQILGACVKANATVTFGLPKIGHVFYPGRTQCGTVTVSDIGFPAHVIDDLDANIHLSTPRQVACLLPEREPTVHKGECGRVVLVAGSVGMTGAAALAAEATLKSGAGLAILAVPASLNDILEVKLTEVMTSPLPEVRKRRCLSLRAVGQIRSLLGDADVLAIGPGLGRHPETQELVRRIVAEASLPTVIDADALYALGQPAESLSKKDCDIVLTPHVGEFSKLSGLPVADVLARPRESALDFAHQASVTVMLKNAPSMVATAAGELFVNPTGNPGLATAGAGDVLTGIIAGLMAQGLSGQHAATLGVYLHGWAADLAKSTKGEMGLVAGDVLRAVPAAIREVSEAKPIGWITFAKGLS